LLDYNPPLSFVTRCYVYLPQGLLNDEPSNKAAFCFSISLGHDELGSGAITLEAFAEGPSSPTLPCFHFCYLTWVQN
jgi:hypothetical protein